MATTFKCRNCDLLIKAEDGQSTVECPHCGTRQEVPGAAGGKADGCTEGYACLREGKWEEASLHFQDAIKENQRNGQAYVGRLLARRHLSVREQLEEGEDFADDADYKMAIRYGNESLRKELWGYRRRIYERKEQEELGAKLGPDYEKAAAAYRAAETDEEIRAAVSQLRKLNGYKDSGALADEGEKTLRRRAEAREREERERQKAEARRKAEEERQRQETEARRKAEEERERRAAKDRKRAAEVSNDRKEKNPDQEEKLNSFNDFRKAAIGNQKIRGTQELKKGGQEAAEKAAEPAGPGTETAGRSTETAERSRKARENRTKAAEGSAAADNDTKAAEGVREEKLYSAACALMRSSDAKLLESAVRYLSELGSYKDSEALLEEAERKLASARGREEQRRESSAGRKAGRRASRPARPADQASSSGAGSGSTGAKSAGREDAATAETENAGSAGSSTVNDQESRQKKGGKGKIVTVILAVAAAAAAYAAASNPEAVEQVLESVKGRQSETSSPQTQEAIVVKDGSQDSASSSADPSAASYSADASAASSSAEAPSAVSSAETTSSVSPAEAAEAASYDPSILFGSGSPAPDWTDYTDTLSKVRGETDPVVREALMHRAESELMDTYAIVPLYYYNDCYMLSSTCSGLYCSPYGTKYFAYMTAPDGSVLANIAGEPDYLDPQLTTSVDGASYAALSFCGLYRYESDGNIVPDLAASMPQVSDDGLTVTVTMKDGLRWSDGDTLDAEDVVYSWNRLADESTGADYSYQCDSMNLAKKSDGTLDIEASADGKSFTARLTAPCSYFTDLCTLPAFYPVPQQAIDSADGSGSDPGAWAQEEGFVCSGPMALISWDHNESMTYEKNPNYWNEGAVRISTASFTLSEDSSACCSAYLNGDLQFIDSIPSEQMQDAMARDDFHTAESLGTYYAAFNVKSSLFDGKSAQQAADMRHAISLLIDRQYIIDAVGQTGQEPAGTFIPDGMSDGQGGIFNVSDSAYAYPVTWEFNGQQKAGYYDPAATGGTEENIAEARRLLEEAGYQFTEEGVLSDDTPLRFTYLTNSGTGHIAIAQFIAMDLETIGIDMDVQEEEWAAFLEDRENGAFDLAREGWLADYDDPVNMLEMWLPDSVNNDAQLGR